MTKLEIETEIRRIDEKLKAWPLWDAPPLSHKKDLQDQLARLWKDFRHA